jgi:hypothetical protein
MVAITGSLAMNNAESGSDLDYLVVTSPDRLWLARAMVVLLVHLAALRGDRICPNYFLSENVLALPEQNIFTAHELVQMVPITGGETYTRMRQLNPWINQYLPNAGECFQSDMYLRAMLPLVESRSSFQSIGEDLLHSPFGSALEAWEMRRKLNKFEPLSVEHPEACFGPDWCKGHVDDHEGRTLQTFAERLELFERMSL